MNRERRPPPVVRLRPVRESDIEAFFEHQLDPAAAWQVAFTREDAADRTAFTEHWARILADEKRIKWTIEVDGEVAGNIVKFDDFGDPEVGYWIGRAWWGRGVGTRALELLLDVVTERPLYGVVAADNIASIRVLEKCGFRAVGSGRAHSHARGVEVDQVVLRLDPPET
jgi:RimJ/RimL family protein N-acetyltransferase